MFGHIPLLSTLIWLPILGAIPVALLNKPARANQARVLALVISIVVFILCLVMYFVFNRGTAAMQFTEHVAWVPVLKMNYALGVDGISMPLVALTCFTTMLVVLASWTMVKKKVGQYLAAFLVMQGAVVGVFVSLDTMLFYFFWEAMLIPMYLSIGIWGMEKRSYAAIKFFLFTFFGSSLLLVALLYLRMHSGSFYILDYYHLKITMPIQILIFLGFLIAFAIKVPMWPLHTWLPDAHTEAPAGGSVVLAALMLKLGAYGFLRFSLPIVPDASRHLDWLMIILSLIAIVYIGFIAIAQTDMKKLIAYSSVAHMGFVTMGVFAVNQQGVDGAIFQMISHGFISGALFLCVGVIYDRMHTREIEAYGGLVNRMPAYALIFMFFTMANVGLPGTSGFVGEFLTLMGIFQVNTWVAAVAALGVILSAGYALWLYRRVVFGDLIKESLKTISDMTTREKAIFAPLVVMTLLLGVYPSLVLDIIGPSVEVLVSNYHTALHDAGTAAAALAQSH